jgi:hypothetical protein
MFGSEHPCPISDFDVCIGRVFVPALTVPSHGTAEFASYTAILQCVKSKAVFRQMEL